MSDLPGFTKLTSTTTKLRDLEMEDTFLQNLQVMNGGSTKFEMNDAELHFSIESPSSRSLLKASEIPTQIPSECYLNANSLNFYNDKNDTEFHLGYYYYETPYIIMNNQKEGFEMNMESGLHYSKRDGISFKLGNWSTEYKCGGLSIYDDNNYNSFLGLDDFIEGITQHLIIEDSSQGNSLNVESNSETGEVSLSVYRYNDTENSSNESLITSNSIQNVYMDHKSTTTTNYLHHSSDITSTFWDSDVTIPDHSIIFTSPSNGNTMTLNHASLIAEHLNAGYTETHVLNAKSIHGTLVQSTEETDTTLIEWVMGIDQQGTKINGFLMDLQKSSTSFFKRYVQLNSTPSSYVDTLSPGISLSDITINSDLNMGNYSIKLGTNQARIDAVSILLDDSANSLSIYNTGILLKNGDIQIENGDLYTSNGNLFTTKGNIYSTDGKVYTTSGNIESTSGNIVTTDGNLVSTNGIVVATNITNST